MSGEGSTNQWRRDTSEDLWMGEGWGEVHGVNKMDTTGAFKKESRKFEEGGFGVD